ncbi:MAG: serine hydrolase domain-containing protein [Microthrixaceae bacterium]
MASNSFSESVRATDEAMREQVAAGAALGMVWAVCEGDETHVSWAGSNDEQGQDPISPDGIFRISSMTKPIAAAAALSLMEQGLFELDEPVDRLLPELADRQVLARSDGPIDETVPATRSITVRDLLTFTLGMGMDFSADSSAALFDATVDLGLNVGPPAPSVDPEPDEWLRWLATLPLNYQPGERWLYHLGSEVLGVLIARAADTPLEAVLSNVIFEPLGMTDTGFFVAADRRERFGPCYMNNPGSGQRVVYDPVDGQWSSAPDFPSAGAGLVSTVADYLAFARMLLAGGRAPSGRRVLLSESVSAMTSDQLTDAQKAVSGPDPDGARSWGYGLAVQTKSDALHGIGSYGWDGGLGTSWANDPSTGRIGILMTNQMWDSPIPPPAFRTFWTVAKSHDGSGR